MDEEGVMGEGKGHGALCACCEWACCVNIVCVCVCCVCVRVCCVCVACMCVVVCVLGKMFLKLIKIAYFIHNTKFLAILP